MIKECKQINSTPNVKVCTGLIRRKNALHISTPLQFKSFLSNSVLSSHILNHWIDLHLIAIPHNVCLLSQKYHSNEK